MPVFFIVVGDGNSVHDAFRRRDLIGTHDHQQIFGSEDAILGEDIQNGMPGKEGLGEVDQIRNDAIVCVRPIGSEFKAIAGFPLLLGRCIGVLDGIIPGAVGIIFGIRAIGDHEDLSILKQTAARPEGIPLVTVDLIERLADSNAPPLQFHMHQREAVDQNSHVIAVIMLCALCLADLILIDDLQEIIVDVLLINQRDVLGCAIIPLQYLHIIFLNFAGLFHNALIGVGNAIAEKPLPFVIRKLIAVQPFQLLAEIFNQLRFRMERKVFISLRTQHFNEFLFQRSFALIAFRTLRRRFVFGNDRVFSCLGDNVKKRHALPPQ